MLDQLHAFKYDMRRLSSFRRNLATRLFLGILTFPYIIAHFKRTCNLRTCSISKLIWNWSYIISAVCDIGSAAFKYDMRRLSEILSFPKSWYRRNLARRLFLGDESGLIDEGGIYCHRVKGEVCSGWESGHKIWTSLYEPPHDKINKVIYTPSKDSDQPGHLPRLIRVFTVHSVGS